MSQIDCGSGTVTQSWTIVDAVTTAATDAGRGRTFSRKGRGRSALRGMSITPLVGGSARPAVSRRAMLCSTTVQLRRQPSACMSSTLPGPSTSLSAADLCPDDLAAIISTCLPRLILWRRTGRDLILILQTGVYSAFCNMRPCIRQ